MTLVILSLFVVIGAWAACTGALELWQQTQRPVGRWLDRIAEDL